MKVFKKTFKKFAHEEKGSAILEFLIMLSVLAAAAALITPVVKEKLGEFYDNQSTNITFGGERGDAVFTEDAKANLKPAVDATPTVEREEEGKLLTFDGATYVQLPDTLMYFGSGSKDFTVDIELEPTDRNGFALLAKNREDPERKWDYYEDCLLIGVYYNTYRMMDGETAYHSTVPAKRDQRYHLTYSIRGNVAYIYENGELVYSTPVANRTKYDNAMAPVIGMETDTGLSMLTDFYEGRIHNYRLYTKGLTESEIKRNITGDVVKSNMLVDYRFNEGTGYTIYDHSGNGNNAKIVGNADWRLK